MLQRGGSFKDSDMLESSLDDMLTNAKKFLKLVAKSPVAFQGIYEHYIDNIEPVRRHHGARAKSLPR